MSTLQSKDIIDAQIVISPGRYASSIKEITDIQEKIRERYSCFTKSEDFDRSAFYYLTVSDTNSFHNNSDLMDFMEISKKTEYGMCFSPAEKEYQPSDDLMNRETDSQKLDYLIRATEENTKKIEQLQQMCVMLLHPGHPNNWDLHPGERV